MRSRIKLAVLCVVMLVAGVVVPPQPALADYAIVKNTQVITGTTTPVAIQPLTGQSSCNVEIVGTAAGTTQGIENGTWVNLNSVQLPDGGAPSPTITGPGTFTANCASAVAFRFNPTSVTGSATITVVASGGIGRIIGAGVNNGKTIVVGSGPITVTNAGNTATIGLTNPLPIANGGTGATALPSGCLSSNGTVVSSTGTACASGSGTVTAVTGTGNIAVTAGATPVVSITNSPTFTGVITGGAYTGNNYIKTSGALGVGVTNTVSSISNYGFFVSGGTSYDNPNALFVNNSSGNATIGGTNGGQTVGTITGQCWAWYNSTGANPTLQTALATMDCSGNEGIAGAVHAASFYGSGVGLTSATVPNAALVTSPVTAVTGTGNIASTGGLTPAISITAAPVFSNVTDSALSSGNCVQASTAGLLTTVAGACGTGSGTVTSVTGTGNISSTGGTTPIVSVTDAPNFAGAITSGTLTNQRCLTSSSSKVIVTTTAPCPVDQLSASFVIPAVGSSVSVTLNAPTYFPVFNNTAIQITDGTNLMLGLVTAGATSGTLTVTNTGLAAGAVGNTMANAAFLSLGGLGTASPSFTGVTVTGLAANACVQTGGSKQLGTITSPCSPFNTSSSFVIPAIGSAVTISSTASLLNKTGMGYVITDGTNAIQTYYNGTNFTNVAVIMGAVGNTMASGATISVGGGVGISTNYVGAVKQIGEHEESQTLSITALGTATFTFNVAFLTAPYCTVATVGAAAPSITLNAQASTTAVTLYNSGAGTVSGNVLCMGW
jgi:hypothetical protein